MVPGKELTLVLLAMMAAMIMMVMMMTVMMTVSMMTMMLMMSMMATTIINTNGYSPVQVWPLCQVFCMCTLCTPLNNDRWRLSFSTLPPP